MKDRDMNAVVTVQAFSNQEQRNEYFTLTLPLAIANCMAGEAQTNRIRKATGGDWIVTHYMG